MSSLAVRGSGPGQGGGSLTGSLRPRRGPAVESANSLSRRLSDARGLGVTSCFTINATQAKSSWICVTRLFSYCTREATIAVVPVTDAVFLTPAKLDSTL